MITLWTIWVSEAGWHDAWMLTAWDEFSVEENHNGWTDAVASAREQHAEVRVVLVKAPKKPFEEAFDLPVVQAESAERSEES